MIVTVRFTRDDAAFQARLNGTRARMLQALREQMAIQMGLLKRYITESKLSGQILKNRTGNLRRSVFNSFEETPGLMKGSVFVANTAPYGRYQEFGAHIPAVSGKLMVFQAGGQTVFTMKHRAFDLRARPFMYPSLAERRQAILTGLAQAIRGAVAT